MEVDGGRNCYTCEALGIWPATVGIGSKEGEWQKKEDWNMEGGKSRESMNIWTI